LHESLLIVKEEGLEQAHNRHRLHHKALAAGLAAIGLGIVVAEEYRLPQLNAVAVPPGINEANVRRQLLQDWDLEIGSGLGALAGKVWRIGLMGHAARKSNVIYCLGALEQVLLQNGLALEAGAALAAAEKVYAEV
jgi:alanine-glyoxylate transaminase/serine-glyoxylate transaminase/serine-pyruvate transaminase